MSTSCVFINFTYFRIVADKHYSGSQFQRCKKFSTFRSAFCYMISKQTMANGDDPPAFDGERITIFLHKWWHSHVSAVQVEYAEDLSGVETPLATSNRRHKGVMAINPHASKFSPSTSSLSFSSFSSTLTMSSPTSSTDMPVTPKLPKRMTPSRIAGPLPDRLHRFQQKQEPCKFSYFTNYILLTFCWFSHIFQLGGWSVDTSPRCYRVSDLPQCSCTRWCHLIGAFGFSVSDICCISGPNSFQACYQSLPHFSWLCIGGHQLPLGLIFHRIREVWLCWYS